MRAILPEGGEREKNRQFRALSRTGGRARIPRREASFLLLRLPARVGRRRVLRGHPRVGRRDGLLRRPDGPRQQRLHPHRPQAPRGRGGGRARLGRAPAPMAAPRLTRPDGSERKGHGGRGRCVIARRSRGYDAIAPPVSAILGHRTGRPDRGIAAKGDVRCRIRSSRYALCVQGNLPEGGLDRTFPNQRPQGARATNVASVAGIQCPVPSFQLAIGIGNWQHFHTGNIPSRPLRSKIAESQARKCCTNVAFALPGVVVDYLLVAPPPRETPSMPRPRVLPDRSLNKLRTPTNDNPGEQ